MNKKQELLPIQYHLSNYYFIWFILYKLNYIKQSPFIAYLFILIYMISKILNNIYKIQNTNVKYYQTIILYSCIIIIVDIIPLFYMSYEITLISITYFIVIFILYLIFMKIVLNKNVYDILNMYNNINIEIIGSKSIKDLLIDKYNIFNI